MTRNMKKDVNMQEEDVREEDEDEENEEEEEVDVHEEETRKKMRKPAIMMRSSINWTNSSKNMMLPIIRIPVRSLLPHSIFPVLAMMRMARRRRVMR